MSGNHGMVWEAPHNVEVAFETILDVFFSCVAFWDLAGNIVKPRADTPELGPQDGVLAFIQDGF